MLYPILIGFNSGVDAEWTLAESTRCVFLDIQNGREVRVSSDRPTNDAWDGMPARLNWSNINGLVRFPAVTEYLKDDE
jgi:hypothetical protein